MNMQNKNNLRNIYKDKDESVINFSIVNIYYST